MSNMSASAKGTADAPGRNVRAKAGLNKAILDQGWFEFRQQLEYKLAWSRGKCSSARDEVGTSREGGSMNAAPLAGPPFLQVGEEVNSARPVRQSLVT